MDNLGRRRSTGGGRGTAAATSPVAAGSVWETRMKSDEVKGGFKVFNGIEDTKVKRVSNNDNNNNNNNNQIGGSVSNNSGVSSTTKRKTWKSDTFEGFERSPIRIGRGKTEDQPKRVVRSEERTPIGVRRQLVLSSKPEEEEVEEVDEAIPEFGSDDAAIEVDDIDVECQDKVIPCSGNVGDAIKSGGDEIEVVEETKRVEIEEIKTPVVEEITKPAKAVVVVSEVKRVSFEKKFANRKQAHETVSLNVKRQSPVIKRATVHSSTKFPPPTADSDEFHTFPESHSRLQSFVDLIMWKDISRSVFIFGIGTFTILSSSYTKDLNISFISIISYLGLVYLAAIFLFRSIVCRGVIDMDYTSYVLGEEEAIWLLKLVLPYLNEFLLKLKALFSGDPSTTIKLAALLFILARCGSSVTIWTMAKLGFFGVFTVPKVCSLYSTQITGYAKFWVRRFRDAWDSCAHKKGVTVAVFLLVWNLSSIIARIWAVFMLFVAFRYYQQSLVTDDWIHTDGDETLYEPIGVQRQGSGPTTVDHTKQKKIS